MVDFFLPYLPLEGTHVRELFRRRLQEEDLALRRHHAAASLAWGDPELDFLVSKARPCGTSLQHSQRPMHFVVAGVALCCLKAW